ncbi:hypothetical protein BD324DRAFT_581987 [Kockovaella imperatae]|uniref:MIF4G domain-containing protein n=1 Tax=Kockovaella imperatae TaxID=4999 RepID=A0A1Y1UE33_9TREE|nr:hypothetical protein BD324DRAFT_581987 [Kockovaella imperatae]ORX35774.1 hypothetical protein BD324DRAFT_581987 [Kockovaella imperatae]
MPTSLHQSSALTQALPSATPKITAPAESRTSVGLLLTLESSKSTPSHRMEANSATSNVPNGSPAHPAQPAHNRKGSIMVGGGVDIQRGNIAFGTANIDSPNPLLSSSPAAPFTTGSHLAGNVKSFGSIDADGQTDSNAVKANRRVSGPGAGPVEASATKQPDLHSLFASKPKTAGSNPNSSMGKTPPPPPAMSPTHSAHGTRPSINGGYSSHNVMPNTMYNSPVPNQTHLRPPPLGSTSQPRSPNATHMLPGQYNGMGQQPYTQNFRPPQANGAQPQMRPNQYSTMQPGRPAMMLPQQHMNGMHSAPQNGYSMMPYPGQGYYDGYNMYAPQQFGINPQWAPQQHPQNQSLNGQLSPLAPAHQLANTGQPSPAPHMNNLPSSSGASPAPTPPTRPASLINHQSTQSNASLVSLPSTPSRSSVTPGTLTPQSLQGQPPSFTGLSGGASTFTPRATGKAIRLTRPDGTAIDVKEAAAAAKGPAASVPTAEKAPETAASPQPPKKKLPTMPIIVRPESEEPNKALLEEDQRALRIKREEEIEAQERKERKERLAREAEEKAKQAAATEVKVTEPEVSEPVKQLEPSKDSEAVKQPEDVKQSEPSIHSAAGKQPDAIAESVGTKEDLKAAKDKDPLKSDQEPIQGKAVASAAASPLASPAMASAGLPPKPVGAATQRRAAPPSLDVKSSTDESSPGPSTLTAARPIEDISTIVYPGSTKSPRPELNVDAKPGKFRYDREFLMQFMHVCREKPENLPPLDEIGLEADASSGFGTSRSGRGGSRSSINAGRGAAPTGLGIGGLGNNRPPFPAQGMGSFNMGSFGSGSIRGTTSEERYNRSLAQGRQSGMARTPSQGGAGGLHGLPPMSMSTSRSGASRSQRGQKRLPQDSRGGLDPDVAPLVSTNNSWVKSRPTGDDEGSPAYIERKVKALLNKLTAEKFDSISMQILEWANKSASETDGMTLKLVIKQIFEKATDEAHWSSMYARLCRLLLERLDPAITETVDGKPVSGGLLFRRYLIGRCQLDFEAGWKAREEAATAAAAKSEEDKERLAQHEREQDGSGEAAMLSDEYYAAQKAKRRGLGLVQLIGELYNMDMIGKGVIGQCFIKLLVNVQTPDEEDIESACKLLTTVGKPFEQAAPENMEIVFGRLNVILKGDAVPSRIKFMIMDVIDLRKSKWESRNKTAGVMTIAEIHQAAAREQAEKTAAAAQAARESISRGGSRAGHSRAQPGEWQSVASSGTRPLQRPTDFSNIGRNISSAGVPSAPTFGPTSVFAKGRGKAAGTTTPPLSRQASTTNMFSALRDEPNEAASERRGSADDSQTQRPKLNLQPRSKPADAEEAEDPKSEIDVDAKLDSDMKELWGEKDAGGSRDPDDIVEYFKSLPEEHRGSLAKRLVDDVFRIARVKDAEVVAKGFRKALEESVTTAEVLKKSLETRLPTLDDEAVDFPQAYNAVATLMKSLSLSDDEIASLASQIEVEGEPRVTPKQKLERALAALDQ